MRALNRFTLGISLALALAGVGPACAVRIG